MNKDIVSQNEKPVKCVIYARFSSDNQREESITAQLRACHAYTDAKGYTVVKEYADEACTGTNDHRPAYQQMLRDAKAHKFEVIVCHKVDRNARNEYDYYYNKMQLAKWGVRMEYAAQGFDSQSPEGQMMESLLVGMAAYYSRNLGREVIKGLKENVYKGMVTGGVAPFGFRIENKKYIVNESEVPAIKYIFEHYLAGDGYISICRWLNEHGYKTHRGNTFGKNSLHDILTNPRYVGAAFLGRCIKNPDGSHNTHPRDKSHMLIVPGINPAIISDELFAAVQSQMERNRRTAGGKKNRKLCDYLLTGLIYCGECGSGMSGFSHRFRRDGRDYVYAYYRCNMKSNKSIDGCRMRMIRADHLDAFVKKRISAIFGSKDFMEKLIGRISEKYDECTTGKAALLADLQKRYDDTEARLNKFYDAIETTGTMDDFDRARMAKLKKELSALASQMENAKGNSPESLDTATIKRYVSIYHDMLSSGNAPNMRAIVNTLIERVTVTRDAVRITYRVAKRGGDEQIPSLKRNTFTWDETFDREAIAM